MAISFRYQKRVVRDVRRLYVLREANSVIGSPEHRMLTTARRQLDAMTPDLSGGGFAIPAFLVGGAVLSAIASVLQNLLNTTAGRIALLAAVTVTSGGYFMTQVVTAKVPTTPFQTSFYRAGHAHAGVFIVLGLVCLVLTEATALSGGWAWLACTGVLVAAIVMPAGFFFSAMGSGRTRPNRWVVLLAVGAAFLIAGLATLGIGLLAA